MKTFFLLLFCITFLFLKNSFAQSDTLLMDKMTIEDVLQNASKDNMRVVSASRSSKSIDDLPLTAYVITQEEILRNGYTTLTDALKSLPGIRISKPGSDLFGEMFLMRGLIGNNYAKILINNVPIAPSVLGGMPIGENLPIAQAERIEVIYGPASAVYGADAMAGVINIITKTTESTVYAQANAVTGEYGYRHFNFLAGGKAGKNKNIIRYSFYGNKGERGDLNTTHNNDKLYNTAFYSLFYNLDTEAGEVLLNNPAQFFAEFKQQFPYYQGTLVQPIINERKQESYMMGMNLQFRSLQLSFMEMYRKDPSNIGQIPVIFSYALRDDYQAEKIQRIALNYNHNWKRFSVTSNLAYIRHRKDPTSSVGINFENRHNGRSYYYEASDDVFGEFLLNYSINKNFELLSGVSYQLSSNLPQTNYLAEPFDENDYEPFTNKKPESDVLFGDFGYNPFSFNNFGAFTQMYYSKEKFTLIAGMRLDAPSNYDAQLFPRAAFLYKFSKKLSGRISIGTSVKAPASHFSFASTALPAFTSNIPAQDSISYEQVPNPNLKPEVFRSTEMGLRYQISKNISLDAAFFINQTDQPISGNILPLDKTLYPKGALSQSPITRAYINDENSTSTLVGLQTQLKIKNLIPRLQLHTDLSLNYARGEEVLPENRGTIDGYRQMPEWILQCNVSFVPFKNAYIRLDNVWMSGWYRRYILAAEAIDLFTNQFSGFFESTVETEGYYNIDIVARYSVNKFLSAYVKVMNVFDNEYGGIDATGLDVDLIYNPQLKRNIQFGVSFKMD